MAIAMNYTKLVVGDVAAAERFYVAMGLRVVSRNLGGEGDVRQEQSWLSATGDMSAFVLILTRFVELPKPSTPAYPGEAWLVFNVDNVDAAIRAVEAQGGSTYRPGENRPEHSVRAAVVRDPEGHLIELVGPMNGSKAP